MTEIDFGFTTGDEDYFFDTKDYKIENDQLKSNLKEVNKMILPLLENLCNSKGVMIKWPNRKEELIPIIEKFKKLTEE